MSFSIEWQPRLHLAIVHLTPRTAWADLSADLGRLPVDAIKVGHCAGLLPGEAAPVLALLTTTLAPDGPEPYVGAPPSALDRLRETVADAPEAAFTLAEILRVGDGLEVPQALLLESYAYSTLLSGPEFAAWRDSRAVRPEPQTDGPAVLLERSHEVLTATLNRPCRHNSFSRRVRDDLFEALEVVRLDPSIKRFELRANGPSFCSGGDLAEFGTAPDPVKAHRTRMQRHVGKALWEMSARCTVYVQGACIGAGCEIPAFADRVVADSSSFFALPELTMGLVPGAGGTVSLPRRIGRWRTACLAMTDSRIDARTALAWGLVDELR